MNIHVRNLFFIGLLMTTYCLPTYTAEPSWLTTKLSELKQAVNKFYDQEDETDQWHGLFLVLAIYLSSQTGNQSRN